jgi:DNA-binding HxlR family transcriptional regulator
MSEEDFADDDAFGNCSVRPPRSFSRKNAEPDPLEVSMTTAPAIPSDLTSFRPNGFGPVDRSMLTAIDEEALHRLLNQPVRQAIVRALLARQVMSFSEIKRFMQLTDGNLSTHARKLEDAGIVTCTKNFKRRLPRTEYRLTPEGRAAVERLMAEDDDSSR